MGERQDGVTLLSEQQSQPKLMMEECEEEEADGFVICV